jgi:type II secretory pathway pseudopilin PulG
MIVAGNRKAVSYGYTLVELLLYVVVVSSLLGAVSFFFSVAVDARIKAETITEVDDQGNALMDDMTRTIRNASSVNSPAAGSNASSVSLVVPTPLLSPTVYSLVGTTLKVTEGAAAAVSLTNSNVDVSGLNFNNLTRSGTPGIIQINFTVSRVNPGNRNVFEYQKTFTSSAELKW